PRCFSLSGSRAPRHLHSFPTRRSSDLEPVLPEAYFGVETSLNTAIPSEMAKHPGLPAATVDFRIGSRSVASEDNYPNSQVSSVGDRKSTRLNSSHVKISYAVFCLKKKR